MRIQPASKTSFTVQEQVLVIPVARLFDLISRWDGLLSTHVDQFESCVRQYGRFEFRGLMEPDERYKQLIPYLVLRHNDSLFVMERRADATESRLSSKMSVGVGGHVRPDDMVDPGVFDIHSLDWAARELCEEVDGCHVQRVRFLGLLNDDVNEVGRVHCGVVYELGLASADVTIKNEHKSGCFMRMDECFLVRDRMERWSQIVLDHLGASFFEQTK